MKSKLVLAVLFILLILSACASPISESEVPSESVPSLFEVPSNSNVVSSLTIKDKSVDGGRFSIEGFHVAGNLVGTADSVVYHNIAEVYEKSTYILYGTAQNIGYWDETGTGQTLYDFVIEKSYKGTLQPGDKITILSPGGYYRLSKFIELNGKERFPDLTEEEIENTVYKKTYMGAPLVENGEKYVVFLDYSEGIPPFPDGVYDEVGAFQGRFYYKDAETLMRYTPENEPNFYQDSETRSTAKQEFTLPELEAEIAACVE